MSELPAAFAPVSLCGIVLWLALPLVDGVALLLGFVLCWLEDGVVVVVVVD